jgi:hypothetical protein
MGRPLRVVLPAVVVTTLGSATVAGAENLVPVNPDFEGFSSGFPDWEASDVVAQEGDDFDGCIDSASYRIEANSEPASARSLTCVPVAFGESLILEVAYRSNTVVDLRLLEYTNSTCTTSLLQFIPDPAIPASAEWTEIRVEKVVEFQSTVAVKLWLRADGDGEYFAEFDRAYLGRVPRIFEDDFEGGSPCRWTDFDDGTPI